MWKPRRVLPPPQLKIKKQRRPHRLKNEKAKGPAEFCGVWGGRLPRGRRYCGAKGLQAAHRRVFRGASALQTKHFFLKCSMCTPQGKAGRSKSKNLTDCPGRICSGLKFSDKRKNHANTTHCRRLGPGMKVRTFLQKHGRDFGIAENPRRL